MTRTGATRSEFILALSQRLRSLFPSLRLENPPSMKLLRVIASLDPATGGPVAGLRAFTPELERLGHPTEFLTLDPPGSPFFEAGTRAAALGPSSIPGTADRLRSWLRQNLPRFDAVIVHGLWQNLGRAVRAASLRSGGPPYFVMPHGMLDPALRSRYPLKHFKKRVYWQFFERRILRDARAVLFTCEEERRLARQSFPAYQCREAVISYGTGGPVGDPSRWAAAWAERCPALAGRRFLVFLGRIHSKKGVELLLHAFGRVARESTAAPGGLPHLAIAGPCSDDSYIRGLRGLAQRHGIEGLVHWPGMLSGDVKWGALSGAEAFVLPSYQENFGLAVVEALACGCPVLLSDRVNIWRELVDDQTALVEPPNEAGVFRLLQRWIALPSEARQALGSAARASYAKRFEISRAATNFAAQLTALLAK